MSGALDVRAHDDDRDGDVADELEVKRLPIDVSGARLLNMLESAPDGMLMTNADGTIVLVNRQLEQLFGYDRNELLGRPVEVLLPKRLRTAHVAHRTRFLQAPEARPMGTGLELLARRRDGSEFPVEISLSPFRDAEGRVVMASVRDVTDRVRAERNAAAERARIGRLEERERIARDLHDIVIQRLFAAGMGLQAVLNEAEADAVVVRIQQTIDELDATIRELRSTIVQLEATSPIAPPIEQVETAAGEYHGALGFAPDLAVDPELDDVAPVIIEQLIPTIHEALSNAARHAAAAHVAVSIAVDDERVELTVTDDGAGLEGSVVRGRGLDNMAARAERLDGTFAVSTCPDGGTRVDWCARR